MQRLLLILAALTALAGGCYWPSFGDCEIRCGEGDRCPGGMSCSNGLCAQGRIQCQAPPPPPSCQPSGDSACPCLPPMPETRADLYVGSDAASSAASAPYCPFSTIGAALDAAASATRAVTVHVAAGRYDADSGERFPLRLRGNVSLVGAGRDRTTVAGFGAFDHSRDGGAFRDGGQSATLVLGDATATVRVSGITFASGRDTLPDSAYTFGLFCDRGNATTVDQTQPARNTLVDDVAIGPGYHSALVVTSSAASGCNLALTRSTLTGSGRGAWLVGCGTDGLGSTVAATLGDGTPDGGNHIGPIEGQAATTGDPGVAISVGACTAELIADGNQIAQAGVGLVSNDAKPHRLVVRNNSFSGLVASGLMAGGQTTIEELRNNRFEGIRAGAGWWQPYGPVGAALIVREGAQVLKARGNLLRNNNTGVYIDGLPISSTRVVDFGTVADPGNNVFRCNAKLDGKAGFGLWVDVDTGSTQPLSFAGNQWDRQAPLSATLPTAATGTDVVNSSPPPAPQVLLDLSSRATVAAPVAGGWYYGKTADEVDQILSSTGSRPLRIQVEDAAVPPHFTLTTVQNVGCYAKSWHWAYDQTDAQINALATQYNARVVDVDPYYRDQTLLFAAILIDENDVDATRWWWRYGVDVNDIDNTAHQLNSRVVSIREYLPVGSTRTAYALVMAEDVGPNSTQWWWATGMTRDEIDGLLMANQSYLIDLEPSVGDATTFNVLMNHDPGFAWTWYQAETAAQLDGLVGNGLRPVGVRSYFVGDQRQLAAIVVGNQ